MKLDELKNYKFIHIPKTSGKYFIEKYGLEYANDYMHGCYNKKYASLSVDWLSYKEINGPTISMIRNPFDWLYSYYSHQNFCGWDGCNWKHGFQSFQQFVISYCDPNFIWHQPAMKKSFITPVCDDQGYLVCDYLLYYENFYESIQYIEYRDKYNNEMYDLCEKKFEKENELFSYDFENRILTQNTHFVVEKKIYFDM
jgi:hypothetical protein